MQEDFIMPQNVCVPDVTLSVPGYDPARGVVIQPEGGDALVRHGESGVEILADPLQGCVISPAGALYWRTSKLPTAPTCISIPGQGR
jgi:hypothetical protein